MLGGEEFVDITIVAVAVAVAAVVGSGVVDTVIFLRKMGSG